MFTGFAHSQLISLLWPVVGIAPCTLFDGQTVNTYSVSPQPAAGIDTWQGGGTLFYNCMLVINVASITAGILAVSLYDSDVALTTANGDANKQMVGALDDISSAGLYYAEFIFEHVFPASSTRVALNEDNLAIRRHNSIEAIAIGGDVVFSVLAIYGFNSRDYPIQNATGLDISWADSGGGPTPP
jgi:hypothetical protein